jgi:hypothetical protein
MLTEFPEVDGALYPIAHCVFCKAADDPMGLVLSVVPLSAKSPMVALARLYSREHALAMTLGDPLVNSPPMLLMFAAAEESETVKKKVGKFPAPDAGETESAVGDPPVTVQLPRSTYPVLTPGSPAYK